MDGLSGMLFQKGVEKKSKISLRTCLCVSTFCSTAIKCSSVACICRPITVRDASVVTDSFCPGKMSLSVRRFGLGLNPRANSNHLP